MKYRLNSFSFWRRMVLFGGLLIIGFGGFDFLNLPAKTQEAKNPVEQNLVNGRLAFSRRDFGPGLPVAFIITSNQDGSGRTTITTTENLFPTMPAWSPDGTKIAFNSGQGALDIYVMNQDGNGLTQLTNAAEAETNPSWSVTGTIAYQRASQIWVMNANGSGQTQFPGITQPSPTGPAWSPDGMKLAFSSGGDIWVINANGTNELRLTMTGSTDTDPAWSPDGSKIVFAKSGSGVTVMNADGSNEITLAGGGAPAWSPDGTKIAYRGSSGIWTMDASGTNQVRIVADVINFPLCCDAVFDNPAWQPVAQPPNTFVISGRVLYDNRAVVGVTVNLNGTTNATATTDSVGNFQFSGLAAGGNYTVSPSFLRHYFTPPNRKFNNLTSNQTGLIFDVLGVCVGGKCVKNGKIAYVLNGDIFVINQDGTNQTNLTNIAGTDTRPNFSPDGTKIVFSTTRDGNGEIYRMDSDGLNPVNLTNNAAGDSTPYYSPDGASIVFSSNRDGNGEIYRMNADGTNPVRLTNSTDLHEYSPAYSPDGTKIVYIISAFQSPLKLFKMNSDGSNQQQIPDNFIYYDRPTYSPDGSKIIMAAGPDPTIRSVWQMNPDGTGKAQIPNVGGSGPSYSRDGTKLAFVCCDFDFTQSVRRSNVDGSSQQNFGTSTAFSAYTDWQPLLVPRAPFDYDGDGRSDISVFRPSNGFWYQLQSRLGFVYKEWGLSSDVLAPGDYDGDLKTDLAVWRPSDGNFYVINSFDNTIREENFGLSGDVPTGGDWDGDGKADVAVYREGGPQHGFHYRGSMGNPNANVTSIPWGAPGDKPVAGDYDGDGRTDAAIFRPSTGTWYVRSSLNGGTIAVNFGLANDKLAPADYDGDGKTDFAVFRDGTWYLLRSAQGFTGIQFGISNDIPAPADYDGDGRADVAIYRNGVWWILYSQTGVAEGVQFGQVGDLPIPSAFVR
jgi:Tol biopolymer transport system component